MTGTTITAPTIPVPPMPRTRLERLRWTVADALTITRRDLTHWIRNPVNILYNLLWPAVTVLMFGYVFGSAMVVAGGGDYREFLMPGMFGQTMIFGIAGTMIAITMDASRGVTDRFRSMPMSQSGVVLGRGLTDMVNSVVELVILVGCGLAVGWSWNNGPVKALAAIGLLLLLRFALIWVGTFFGLMLTPETAGASWILLFPITFLANTFASPTQMPTPLRLIAEWNPLSATVAACRELFGNPGLGGDSWAAEHALLLAIAWPTLLVLVFLPLSVRRYRNLNR